MNENGKTGFSDSYCIGNPRSLTLSAAICRMPIAVSAKWMYSLLGTLCQYLILKDRPNANNRLYISTVKNSSSRDLNFAKNHIIA